MPSITGTELAHTVRQRHFNLPVLIVSGYAEVEGIAPDLPRRTKPFRPADLVASLTGLGCVCKGRQPEHDHGQGNHGEVVGTAFLVAGGDAAEVFKAVDEALDPVAFAIGLPVKAALAPLVPAGGDHGRDAAGSQLLACARAGVGLVAGQAPRP
jgi:hypothetical protein